MLLSRRTLSRWAELTEETELLRVVYKLLQWAVGLQVATTAAAYVIRGRSIMCPVS